MRSFAVLSAAGLAAAQVTSIVITNGLTTTITLPVFPEPTFSATATVTVPETTVTVTPSPSTTLTISAGTSTVEGGITTTTVVIPSLSVSDPVVSLPTISEVTTITTPVVLPTVNTTFSTQSQTRTFYTSTPNATTSGPVTVPTAAADKVALKGSAAGLVAFGIASFFLF